MKGRAGQRPRTCSRCCPVDACRCPSENLHAPDQVVGPSMKRRSAFPVVGNASRMVCAVSWTAHQRPADRRCRAGARAGSGQWRQPAGHQDPGREGPPHARVQPPAVLGPDLAGVVAADHQCLEKLLSAGRPATGSTSGHPPWPPPAAAAGHAVDFLDDSVAVTGLVGQRGENQEGGLAHLAHWRDICC